MDKTRARVGVAGAVLEQADKQVSREAARKGRGEQGALETDREAARL